MLGERPLRALPCGERRGDVTVDQKWKVEFSASLPPMFTGLRVGATLAVVGGNVGLGYLLTFGEGQANTPLVFVCIVMLTLVGGIAYLAVILVERRVLHYLPARGVGGDL